MDFNPLEETSPFAPFWHARNQGFDDAHSSPNSVGSQSLQTDDAHLGNHQPDGPAQALTTTSLRDVANFPPTSPDRPSGPHFDGDAMQVESESESMSYSGSDSEMRNAPDERLPASDVDVPAATGGEAEGPSEAAARAPAQQDRSPSPIAVREEIVEARAAPHRFEESMIEDVDRAHSALLSSAPPSSAPISSAHVAAEPTPSASSTSKPSSPAREAEPARVEEEDTALEAQIHQEESFAHSPRHSPAPVEPIAAEVRVETAEQPQEAIEHDATTPAVDQHVEKLDEQIQVPAISPPEPIEKSLPERRRQSSFQVLQTEAKEQAQSVFDKTSKRRASAPAAPGLISIEIPARKSRSPKPAGAAAAKPAKRGRPRKSEPIMTTAKRPRHVVTTPLRAKAAKVTPQTATTIRRRRETQVKESATKATPATARRGRPPVSAAKPAATTTETPKRRGRPPKSAATPSAAPPKTPASQTKRSVAEARVTGTGEKSAKIVRGSTQRKAPSSRTSVRVVKRTPVRGPPINLSASTGKRRGRPPKEDLSKTQEPISKSEEKTRPTRGTGRLASVPFPKAKPEKQPPASVSKTERTRAAAAKKEETSETPAKRRGRPPREVAQVHVAEVAKEAPVKPRGRQPKPVEAEKPKPSTAEPPVVKRRGRPPAAAAAAPAPAPAARGPAKTVAKPTAATTKDKAAVETSGATRGRRGRLAAEDASSAAKPAPTAAPATKEKEKEVGVNAAKKRGRPSREVEVAEEPRAKRVRSDGAVGVSSVKAVATGPGRRSRQDAAKPVSARPAAAKPAPAKTAADPAPEKVPRGRGRQAQAAAVAAPPPPPPPARGRPARKAQETDAKPKAPGIAAAKPRGRPAKNAAPAGPVAKAARPQGIVKKAPATGARGTKAMPSADLPRRTTRARG